MPAPMSKRGADCEFADLGANVAARPRVVCQAEVKPPSMT
jgi:hypothetical protein